MEEVEATAIEIIRKHLKVLTDQENIKHINKEYFELAISHSLLTVWFLSQNSNNIVFWHDVRKHIIKIVPSTIFNK